MKWFVLVYLLAYAAAATAQPFPSGDSSWTIQHGGVMRHYRVHVPANLPAGQPAPLLVALHGGGGHMDYQADEKLTGIPGKADAAGFIAVFPNGYSRLPNGKLATWNAGHCCGQARDRNVDDVGFIRAVVDEVSRRAPIDRQRIYATGMSNGGMMAYRLACDAADLFAGIAPVAGTDNTRACAPSRPVRVVHIHARDDDHVLFEGGAGPHSMPMQFITNYASVPATVAKWAKLDGCAAEPKRVLDKQGAYCEAYTGCTGAARVQLCVTESGGHSWPGGRKVRGGAGSPAISAVDVMWDFFNQP